LVILSLPLLSLPTQDSVLEVIVLPQQPTLVDLIMETQLRHPQMLTPLEIQALFLLLYLVLQFLLQHPIISVLLVNRLIPIIKPLIVLLPMDSHLTRIHRLLPLDKTHLTPNRPQLVVLMERPMPQHLQIILITVDLVINKMHQIQ